MFKPMVREDINLFLFLMDSLNFLAWNLRGYNHHLKKKELKTRVLNKDVCCGAILETRVRQVNMEALITS